MSAFTKVSVLMPIYHTEEKYLRDSIESILGQTFKDFEFLILNDSPDDEKRLKKIVDSYNDPRIFYYKNEHNLGISLSRNRLLELAHGEYIAVMDHDDISLPERLEKEVNFLDKNPTVGVVGSSIVELPKHHVYQPPIDDETIRLKLMHDCVVIHPSSMIRREVLTKNHIQYVNSFTPAEDYALWCQLVGVTHFANLPDILLYYRKHSGNTSRHNRIRMRVANSAIHQMNRSLNPELFKISSALSIHRYEWKLFGFIPFLTRVCYAHKQQIFLFRKLLIWSSSHQKKFTK